MVGVKRTCQLQNPENPALPLGVYCYKNLKFFLFNRLLPEKTILLVYAIKVYHRLHSFKKHETSNSGQIFNNFLPILGHYLHKLVYLLEIT